MDYMSPEQIRGEAVTGAADTYSLGCVMFECGAGRPPFADRQGMRVLWAHLQDEPPDPPPQQTDIPSALTKALKAALRKEPPSVRRQASTMRAHSHTLPASQS
jgi:serine/threonine protein kinase